MSVKKIILILIVVDIFVLSVFFLNSGFFAERSDTRYFVTSIEKLRGVSVPVEQTDKTLRDLVYFRGFKPFYGFLGAGSLRFLSPQNVILFLNMLFLFGLTISAYYLFCYLGFDGRLSMWGSIWVTVSYPMLKYGLALMTDISGWFFATVTIVAFLYGLKHDRLRFLFFASILGFLGSISKETGVMGMVFSGIYLLINYKEWGIRETTKKLLVLCLPFLFLYGSFSVWMHSIGAPSFVEWYKYNYDIYFNDFYKLRYFLTNEFLSLNIIYLFSLLGIIYIFLNKDYLKIKRISVIISAFIPSVLVLFWPVFYYRVFFIQFIFFVPLALYAFYNLDKKGYKLLSLPITDYLGILPPIVSIVLFFLISKM